MSESVRPGAGGSGRSVDLLVTPSETVYRVIMDTLDLDHGDGEDSPPPPEDGDNRPDPDWRLVGLTSFMVSFCGVSALRYAIELVRLVR